MSDTQIIENISGHFAIQIYKAFNHSDQSIKALEIIAKSLRKELYRYFEPSFFSGKFFVCKHFDDAFILDEKDGVEIYDKNILLNITDGVIVIQVLNNDRLMMWENVNTDAIFGRDDMLTYLFEENKEYFFANAEKIEIPFAPPGSMFATQFYELAKALNDYKTQRVFRSTCPIFSEAWFDDNHIFFKGGGKDIPEKHLQQSLHHYLDTNMNLRGITPILREFNVLGDTPKPVDIVVNWGEANRLALIEVKWLGKSIPASGNPARHDNSRANEGIKDLKEKYFDQAQANMPRTIIKAYLIVIDARRHGTNRNTVTISYADGRYYENIELTIDGDKRFYQSIPGFEKPIRMFAAPICV